MGGLPNLPPAASGFYPVNPTIGNPPAPNPAYPGYQSLLWLAQLSVNIVDFIDSDNYITPFNWNPNDTTNGWVYGTEQPRLVINEAYAEIVNNPNDTFMPGNVATMPYNVNAWVELHNPLPADPSIVDIVSKNAGFPTAVLAGQGVVRLEMPGPTGAPLYQIYQLAVSTLPAGTLFANPQLGTPNTLQPGVGVSIYSATPNPTLQTVVPAPANTSYYSGPEGKNLGFYVIGPQIVAAQNPFKTAGVNKLTPTLSSEYDLSGQHERPPLFPTPTFFDSGSPVPICHLRSMQRLAHVQPYVTVDYFTFTSAQLQANDARSVRPRHGSAGRGKSRHSYGRMQPFGGAQSMNMQQLPDAGAGE